MSENQNRDFSKYDSMTTEALEEILRLDANAPEGGESDVELLLYVMEVLANRRRNTENTGKTALEAWESFQREYLDDEDDALKHTSGKKTAPWLRRLLAAAAAIVLVICIPLTAQALGWADIWNVFARWAKETFSFASGEDVQVSEPDTVSEEGFTSLRDALSKSNRDASLVPVWIPDGYVLDIVEKDINPIQENYNAIYKKGDAYLIIRVMAYLDADPEKIEINENLLDVYERESIQYYIFSNVDQIQVIWSKDSYECIISSELTIEEIKSMIDSIGKG